MKKILLTGFEAFGEVEENPTQVIVEEFAKKVDSIDYAELVCEIIPVEYELSGQRIRELIDKHQPDAIVMTGVAARWKKINIEFWARNNRTASIPDNSGVLLENQPINPDEPVEHFLPSTLPVSKLYTLLQSAGIPVERSNNAGGYICNNIFYSAVEYLRKRGFEDVIAGFVHIPTFDAIEKDKMTHAYDEILRQVAQSKATQYVEANTYMNPAIERELQKLLEKLPDKPIMVALVNADCQLAGYSCVDGIQSDQVSKIFKAWDFPLQRISRRLKGTINCIGQLETAGTTYFVSLTDVYFIGIHWTDRSITKLPRIDEIPFQDFLQSLRDLLE